ncbi:hypothetical protein A6P39_011750 [Streptomyces sp. FXJ1.172]|uniref:hypothetical protein n=1 Tax=Streptomyces sp. FXJ1.172 TaxID=710705 RepID=UPI0007CFD6C4|nr:hypothetical protein [Streptomyces sp. FXJ1.172]WEP00509.1 hypothetical protein A6P39_011750 [Streptomyces sp. FXJ1.172]
MPGTPGPHARRTRSPRSRTRPLRTRLPLLVSATLAGVCAVLVLTTVLAQRAFLMGALDDRVKAAAHGVTGAARHRARPADLAFLGTGSHPDGLLGLRRPRLGEAGEQQQVLDQAGHPGRLRADPAPGEVGGEGSGAAVRSEPGRAEFRIELPVAQRSFTQKKPSSARLSGPLRSPA